MELRNGGLYSSLFAVAAAALLCSSVVCAGFIWDRVLLEFPSFLHLEILFSGEVKVPVWVDGKEVAEFVGVGARFGKSLESKEKRASQTKLALADPPDCCSTPRNKLAGEVILVHRGNCSFVTKGNVAEDAGASALLIINNEKELFKMVCEANETDVRVGIPVVMLPQDAGQSLKESMTNSSHVMFLILPVCHFLALLLMGSSLFPVSIQMYSPQRPEVDVAEVFLWLMAVGTILCASYWSAWSAREAAIEHDKLVKDGADEFLTDETVHSSGVVEINTTSAVLFVVIASCFLIMLYKLMSSAFIEVLVVVFCIGGVEGLQTCLVALLS
ncbi:hypothetical protein SASPL_102634 [Salvia splendens]|uniref:PA domain-containing protein n=1 Tax=Salvia splendens TaxID=180675 RepID=A0A8X8YRM8_SALSN|nr:hypothetical protein SASPL_102634 [Salvia splendens]